MERAQREEEFKQFSHDVREEFSADLTCDQMKDTQDKISAIMSDQFHEYVPLNNHLHRYQMRAMQKYFSKTTPKSELTIYNLYTGGEGQTEERMGKLKCRQASSIARDDSSSEEEDN